MHRRSGIIHRSRIGQLRSSSSRIGQEGRRPSPTVAELGPRAAWLVVLGFAIGYGLMGFACKTRLFDFAAEKKMQRRLNIDEAILDLRGNLREWEEEDKARALSRT
uniref:Uncharacterized protein n=1 Tax=Neobodo designis TaxID=312471 RepID=A0A7S1MSP8_NEODS|mmetsp:Transcript_45824/g.141173  ORF Transcript_45824/g.141173 Transcript_45824/m.141173 type:complete len:106 (+) Transcript_45824:34-351(+)